MTPPPLPNESSLSDRRRDRLGRLLRRACDVAGARDLAREQAILEFCAEPPSIVTLGAVMLDLERRREIRPLLDRETEARRLRLDIDRACALGWWHVVAELTRRFVGVAAAQEAA